MSQPAAIILAAGGSTRMGQPKALLDLRGRPLILAHIQALSVACNPVIVVLGAHETRIADQLPDEVRTISNPDWAQTETKDSIAMALQNLPPETTAVVTPVDVPPVPVDVLEMLLDAGAPAVPTDEGMRGHPVVIHAGAALEALSSAPLHTHLADAVEIDVEWPDCIVGFNTPEEWSEWLD